MGLTTQGLKNPAAVAVIVVIAMLLGLLSLTRLPVQLFPNIERPTLTVSAGWRAASPREIESEIVQPIEEVLQGLPGLIEMSSSANSGRGSVRLEFALATDMDQAFTEVTSRLQQVNNLPADADRPRVRQGGGREGDNESLIQLFVQRLPGSTLSLAELTQLIEDQVAPAFEAVAGVASVSVRSATGSEALRVVFDPYRLAQLGLSVSEVAQRVGRSNDVSGGQVEVGRRSFALRFEGRYSPDELSELILDWRGDTPIRLGDVAEVSVGPIYSRSVVFQDGNRAISLDLAKETGANVLGAISAVTEIMDRLNATVLADAGARMQKSFDPSVFINRAVALVTNNLLVGMGLAVVALWWFLRRARATLLIATTIPICIMTTFLVLDLFGRSVNIISLAGLAFATGMVMDAAIVVLENIVRLREQGRDAFEAADTGARQVWGALLASTATTVAIFLPIIFLKDVEGQLFADLALTIAIAVSISLVVAVTVLPAAARLFLRIDPRGQGADRAAGRAVERGREPGPGAEAEREPSAWWDRLAHGLMALTATRRRRIAWVAVLLVGPLSLSYLLWPQTNYLPPVKRDAVDAFISFPSGYNAETIEREFADVVIERLEPYVSGAREPALQDYFLVSGSWGSFMGVRPRDQGDVDAVVALLRSEVLAGFPDVVTYPQQGNLFGGFGGAGSISLYLQSADFPALSDAVVAGADVVREVLPGARVRPTPDPQTVAPEIRLTPDDRRIAEVGLTRDGVAQTMRAMGDGIWLGEYFDGDKRMDIILRAAAWSRPEFLEDVPIATPNAGVLPLGDLVSIRRDVGPSRIQRVDGRRTITLTVVPPPGVSLEAAVRTLREQAEPRLRALLPADASLAYGGDADSLDKAVATLGGNFGIAVVLLFLIMAALFKSVKDAALVIVSLPMATVGGVVALWLLNRVTFAPLDLLGMIGFIILLGLVVNNAILLVVETRRSEDEGLDRRAAVHQALRLRLRPIFMSTLTSIAGMLPLVLIPGAGSRIYQGMATVIVGGMSVSTLFTLILLPSLLQLGRSRRRVAPDGSSDRPGDPAAAGLAAP
ncbi:multidrug efflux pump subunit AcrB [Rhodothalassium salexigens DSM 2132]|uniref:Multidrug efflux pump subunit AcrB n=1 Tax=Rhodothalassium salexigens DSM 2132 TaxID=1188247 RepID=A0A4R2PQE3_RHOSA|nr:efflux RND transporter permease subunit [Rhodothalassium salexigens]MBB4210453.1 multidrug efflux pump subunit AcrB [Rhodothalassium salexigens DSM 2132]MBK1638223.1 acriflavine resistance protein B [Rhodothalassium salexigens DSM 2132]TCP37990.1 multidrug efflux pump subunit AcrB [Rhodothalassium salexigens DSM 2132]